MPRKQKILSYTVVFEPAEEGGYCVHVPALPGCFTQGETLDEARKMAREAIRGHIEALAAIGEPIPEETEEPAIPRTEKIDVRVRVA
jgi:predicted RNase H-like HicB family nuclease